MENFPSERGKCQACPCLPLLFSVIVIYAFSQYSKARKETEGIKSGRAYSQTQQCMQKILKNL